MTWGEAVRITRLIAKDSSSHLAAAISGWQHPVTREWFVLWGIHWATVQKFKQPEKLRLPLPWDKPPTKHGSATMSVDRMRALLDRNRSRPATTTESTTIRAEG